jgi:hypothetical protein
VANDGIGTANDVRGPNGGWSLALVDESEIQPATQGSDKDSING